jgi:hypothetical protein
MCELGSFKAVAVGNETCQSLLCYAPFSRMSQWTLGGYLIPTSILFSSGLRFLILWLSSVVFRIPGYRSRGPGFDSRRYQIFGEVMRLERGSLSLVGITEELLEWKSSGSGSRKSRLTTMGICCADHATSSIRKFGTNFHDKRRSLGWYSLLAD